MNIKNYKILIVGGGVAGLSLASFLEKSGSNYLVVEKAPEWKTIGYFLAIWSNGLRVFEKLGLDQKLRSESRRIPGFRIYNEKSRLIYQTKFDSFLEIYECERDTVHRILRDSVPTQKVKLNTTVKEIVKEGERARVYLSDGTDDLYDLVVGSDGINSSVRPYVNKNSKKYYTGHAMWLYWLPKNITNSEYITSYAGDGMYVGVYPTSRGERTGVYFSIPHRESHISDHVSLRQDILKRHVKIEALSGVLKYLPEKPEALFHNNDYEVHLGKWYKDNIVLIGDAAHATSPIMSMGASMALEDSYVLFDELSKSDNLETALKNFSARRQPRTNELVQKSKQLHRLIAAPKLLDLVKDFFDKNYYLPKYFEWQKNFSERKVD